MSKLLLTTIGFLLAAGFAAARSDKPPKTAESDPLEMVVEDQFSRRQDIAAYRGEVVVLVYGDRKSLDSIKTLWEKLHILFHPTAAGLPLAKARSAPVADLPGVPAGKRSPDVIIVPVVSVGGVPGVVKDVVRTQIKKSLPEIPVWLDASGHLEKEYGLKAGQTNIVILDSAGRFRQKVNGTLEPAAIEKMLQLIQNLRADAAGIKK